MTTAQKIIKYLALAFAAFLIINIIGAIMVGIFTAAFALGVLKPSSNSQYLQEITTNIEEGKIATLNINVEATNVKIKTGDLFKAESNNSKITCKQNNNQLVIKEKHEWFNYKNNSELIIYIPENLKFEAVKIDTGAGKVNIDKLQTESLSFNMGAGEVQIKNLVVEKEAKISGGAGKAEITSGSIKNLKLDVGVGKFTLTSKLSGTNDIDAGVGKLDINLTDGLENYTIKASKGIGSILIDGKEIAEDEKYGNGDTYIKVDGGIGEINID